MEIGQGKKIFLMAKKSENVTARTLDTYNAVLQRFNEFIFAKQVYDVSEVDANCIREFLISLQEKGLRGVTRHIYYRVINTYLTFLFRNDYITKNPMTQVQPPKVEQKEMRTFTAREISKLLNAFDKTTFSGYRNYTIFCLFFSTGIRKMELLNLKVSDINITTDFIRIANGKGQKERFAPIGRTMKLVLKQYLVMREELLNGEKSPWLFIAQDSKSKIGYTSLGTLFQVLKKELGLQGERVSCHTWRHTFAKNYLLNGGDLFSLQKILGHSDISSTRKYLNLTDKEVKAQHSKFNPLDNKDWL